MNGVSETGLRTFADLMLQETGNMVTSDKAYMVESRLKSLVHEKGLSSLDELAARLSRPGANSGLTAAVVDRLTTHETYFFRDKRPFDRLAGYMIPRILRTIDDGRPLRIWCAACSTGQEPYSLAILLHELADRFGPFPYEIVATDIARATIERAREGVYNDFEIERGLRPGDIDRHFVADGARGWRVRDELRQNISFKVENLIRPRAAAGSQDVILCRYALIYMDKSVRSRVLSGLADRMRDDSSRLLLGTSEASIGICDRLEWKRDDGPGVFALAAD